MECPLGVPCQPMPDDRVTDFWKAYLEAGGRDGPYTAWAFGDEARPEMQTKLALLVLNGPKRATTGLLAEYEAEGEPLPQAGEYSVILDGGGDPRCVVVTTSVEVRPLSDVDAEYAWTEGEGDRTLAWWRQAHVDFFARLGISLQDDTQLVLERFDLVWPPSAGQDHGGPHEGNLD